MVGPGAQRRSSLVDSRTSNSRPSSLHHLTDATAGPSTPTTGAYSPSGMRSAERPRSTAPFTVTNQPVHVARHSFVSGASLRQPSASAVRSISQPGFSHDELQSMVHALQYGSVAEQGEAGRSLRSASKASKATRLHLVQIGGLPVLADCLTYVDPTSPLVTDAVTICYNLAMEPELARPIALAGIIDALLKILKTKCAAQLNAAGAVSNLCINETNRQDIRDAGGISTLVSLVRNGNPMALQKDAVVALFNMAIDPRCRKDIVELGLVTSILDILDSSVPSRIEAEVSLLLSSLLKVPAAVEEVLQSDGVAVLSALLDVDPKVQGHATACLLLVAMHGRAALKAVKEDVVVASLVQIAERGNSRGREKVRVLA